MTPLEPAACRPAEPLTRPAAALLTLFKLRVVALLLAAASGGAFLAAGGWPGTGRLVVLLVAGGLAASGASAVNQYLERDVDARMERTRHRPLAAGSVARPAWVPVVGAFLILAPALAVWPSNPALSTFLLLGAGIYVGVYTLWLKPRTLFNIVVGGAAGSAAVLSGSAAAGRWDAGGALLLALLVFVWTPTHFWSLALAYREDYARGGFPMLPVRTSPRAAATWILLHSVATAACALALVADPALGWAYGLPVALATAYLQARSLHLLARPDRHRALALFHSSNLALAVVLAAACVDLMLA